MHSIKPSECRDRRGFNRCRHRNYAMSCEEFEDLWQRAGGRCQICRSKGGWWILFIDHDNDFDKTAVRGLLCQQCNANLHKPSLDRPERDAYLAGPPWYKTVPGRPTPRPVENPRLARWEARRLAAVAIRQYLTTADLKPTVRQLLSDIADSHHKFGCQPDALAAHRQSGTQPELDQVRGTQ